MSSWRGLALGLVIALFAARATAEGEAPVLSVREVISRARQHNPALRSALLELESARLAVTSSEAAYEPVLLVDASGAQIASPNLFGSSVRITRVRRAELAAELRKHFLWGTDLSLRLTGNAQKTAITGGAGGFPTTMIPTTLGMNFDPSFLRQSSGSFGPFYGMVAKLTLKQPLWRGRGREVGEADVVQARARRTESSLARDRTTSQLLRELLTAYYELWYAEASLAIERSSQAVSVQQRDEAARRAQTGSLAPADVLTFEAQLASRDESLLAAETERGRRVHELARLIGGSESASGLGAIAEEPSEPAFVRDSAEQRAFESSPEVRERSAALERARIEQRTADDPQKPKLDLDGYVQFQGLGEDVAEAGEQFVSGEVVSAYLGLSYEAPVRDRVRRAAAARARLATELAEVQLREVRERIVAELRTALEQEASARKRVALSERTASIAGEQLRAEQARYRAGSATAIAVLEAEDNVRGAGLRLARARADLSESVLALEHLTGELLTRYAGL